jgi:hydrogenase maturation protease
VRNDQVGLLVGEHIAREIPPLGGLAVRQFTGSPLALLQEVWACSRLILIDSICAGCPIGTVRLFTEEDLLRAQGDLSPHGMNLPAVLALARRMQVALPRWIRLIGIEVGSIQEFGAAPEPDIAARMDGIAGEALCILRQLLGIPECHLR